MNIKEALTFINTGMDACKAGRVKEALKLSGLALEAMGATPNDANVMAYIEIYSKTGFISRKAGHADHAQMCQENAMRGVMGFQHKIDMFENPYYPIISGELGRIAREKGEYEEALEYLEEALRIFKRQSLSGANYLNIAKTYRDTGSVLSLQKKYKEAIKMYNEGLKILKDCPEASGLDAAEILNYKGITLMSLKEYGAAADMLRRAFDKGGHDPVIASAVYRNMWKNLTHQGKHREAAEKLTAALEFYQNEGPLAEKVGEKANIHVNLIAMCCKQGMDEKAEEQTQALIDWIPELYRNMMRIDDEGIRKDQLAKAFYMPSAIFAMTRRYSGILPERAYSVLLCAKDIGKEAEFSLTEHMTPAMVCEALPSDCALLDYLVFYDEERDEAPGGGKNYYLVFLVRDGRIKIFFLGEEAPVNNMLRAARERIVPSPDRSNKPEDAFVELAALYKRLIAPLAVELNGVKHLFIAPDSELFKMPFELLRDKNNQRLSDGFSVSYLSSGRDLVRLKDRGGQNRDFQSAVILADPKYDLLDSDPHPKKRNNANNTPKPPWGRGTVRKCGSLPYTRDEAESLNKVFQGKKMICYQLDARKTALEAAVKEMGPPDIIHIATHGFFAERKTDARWTDDDRMDAHHYMEDPLNRSGLMLAGVNDWLDNRELPVEYGNGILYAKEVLNLNLQGTELITLSACETGLGEAETGMGIQGLRRAFELAGVATVICTLWNVDDASSAILMERFYMNWLEKKMGKLAALDEAKKYLRDMSRDDYAGYFKRKGRAEINGLPLEVYIALEPGEKPREAPFYWAGYVLQGDIA